MDILTFYGWSLEFELSKLTLFINKTCDKKFYSIQVTKVNSLMKKGILFVHRYTAVYAYQNNLCLV